MVYVIGVSSGFFGVVEQAEKARLMTIPRKIFTGGLEGVNFTQIDIESITEFMEPNLEKETKKIREAKISFGVHGESYAMGGAERPIGMLDSATEVEYIHSHERLIQHIEGCGKIGAVYVNIHPSETVPFIRLGVHLEPTKVVDPWGRPLKKFLEENSNLIDWIFEKIKKEQIIVFGQYFYTSDYLYEREIEPRYIQTHQGKEPTAEEKEKLKKEAYKRAKEYLFSILESEALHYGPERIAYFIIAKWMRDSGDPLWKNIVGKYIKDEDLEKPDKIKEWVPAVSAKYIWGHFNPKDTGKFKDPKKLLEKYKMYFIFETGMGSPGIEGLQRLSRPRDMVFLCKAIGSKWVGVCFDFEHVLSQNINPEKEIESIPYGMANVIKVCHIGFPTPHAPAHMPIPLGSSEQLYLYERLFELRKKGFGKTENGYLIFERGAAPREETVLAMRLIKDFLEKDTLPKELPLSFFGMKPEGPEIKRQELTIREHALDPLKGMLAVPEEEYTFLSKAAIEKGKAEEWKKEKYR